jgi:Uma2 family endonuclease
MSATTAETAYQLDEKVSHELDAYYEQVVTEDDQPVDNFFSAKQQTLLKRPLYASWTPPAGKHPTPGQKRTFLADSDIGVFFAIGRPPRVPDFFLSLDVQPRADWYEKRNRSYFLWEFGKVPEVVVEIVSNTEGGELDRKLDDYAEMGVKYYVVYDPQRKLKEMEGQVLQVYELSGLYYRQRDDTTLPGVGLSLTLWQGVFEDKEDTWLRWCDEQGAVIPTGEERAAWEAERADQETERAAQETERAAREAQRADHEAGARRQAEELARIEAERAARLAEKLRELGIDPEQV